MGRQKRLLGSSSDEVEENKDDSDIENKDEENDESLLGLEQRKKGKQLIENQISSVEKNSQRNITVDNQQQKQ